MLLFCPLVTWCGRIDFEVVQLTHELHAVARAQQYILRFEAVNEFIDDLSLSSAHASVTVLLACTFGVRGF